MAPSFCPSCGAPLESEARFCGECGHQIGATGATTATSTPGRGEAEPSPAPAGGAAVGAPAPASHHGLLIGGLAVLAVLLLGLLGTGIFLAKRSASEGEIFLESAASTGPDPFTGSTATSTSGTGVPTTSGTSPGTTRSGGQTGVETTQGSTPGLYGGTMNNSSCNRTQQIQYLQANPAVANAFAGVLGITVSQIPDYLKRLTPVLLLRDTRVTNHGYANGAATSRQSVLQAGTAVLVDEYGIPRVRCFCGNPLTPPAPVTGTIRYQGTQWPGFSLDNTIVVTGTIRIEIFVLVDIGTGLWFDRPAGTDGSDDHDHTGGGTTTTSPPATGATTTTSGGTQSTVCAPTAAGAVDKLLDARRRNDRVTASSCGSVQVLDYLWRLSDGAASSLRAQSCTATNQFGPTQYNDEVDLCTVTNNLLFAVPRTARPPNENWFVSFVVLADGNASSTTTSTAQQAACNNGQPDAAPQGKGQQVVVDYFDAINRQDYATAWGYLDRSMRALYGAASADQDAAGLATFSSTMRQHVKCVRVTKITLGNSSDPDVSASLGIQWWQVSFDAEYLTPFEAGSGTLPPFYKTHADPHDGAPAALITNQATGL